MLCSEYVIIMALEFRSFWACLTSSSVLYSVIVNLTKSIWIALISPMVYSIGGIFSRQPPTWNNVSVFYEEPFPRVFPGSSCFPLNTPLYELLQAQSLTTQHSENFSSFFRGEQNRIGRILSSLMAVPPSHSPLQFMRHNHWQASMVGILSLFLF